MSKGKIYWFTGQPSHGKTVLGKKLVDLLQTERRNWRKDVFHIDGEDLRDITSNKDYSEQGIIDNVKRSQLIAEYLSNNECDVVVSLVSPYDWLREEFKEKIGLDNFQEFYVHCSKKTKKDQFHSEDYVPPQKNFFDVDTTKDTPEQSFTKIVNYLTEEEKL